MPQIPRKLSHILCRMVSWPCNVTSYQTSPVHRVQTVEKMELGNIFSTFCLLLKTRTTKRVNWRFSRIQFLVSPPGITFFCWTFLTIIYFLQRSVCLTYWGFTIKTANLSICLPRTTKRVNWPTQRKTSYWVHGWCDCSLQNHSNVEKWKNVIISIVQRIINLCEGTLGLG